VDPLRDFFIPWDINAAAHHNFSAQSAETDFNSGTSSREMARGKKEERWFPFSGLGGEKLESWSCQMHAGRGCPWHA